MSTFLVLLFKYSTIVTTSTIKGIELWLFKIFPSLFIMFIFNHFVINTNACYYLNKLITPISKKLFNLSGESSMALILSIFSGTPSNAYIIKELYLNQSISKGNANRLLAFTYFSNPFFLYNILSINFPKNIVIKLILIHYLTNIIIIFIFRKHLTFDIIKNKQDTKINYFKVLEAGIKKSIDTLLMILGTITFFMIISNLLINVIDINNTGKILIQGIFEITSALNNLHYLNVSNMLKEIITIAIISFSGLSIHMQIFSIISSTNLEYKYYFYGRCLHVIISVLITYLTNII